MDVKKVIIPVAGLGVRMLPITKTIPKEMLPIVDKPIIQYIVEECAQAGLTEIVFVTHQIKGLLENHFDTNYELESVLKQRENLNKLDELHSITPKGVNIISIRQGEALGLGHAILTACSIVGDEPFAVVLPDVLIDSANSNLSQMIEHYKKTNVSQILVEEVNNEDVEKYGIVDLAHNTIQPQHSVSVHSVIEKPHPSEAPSNLSIMGRYVFSPHLWQYLKKTELGVGGEIQLTDAMRLMMHDHNINASLIDGKSHDCGSIKGYLKTNFLYASRRKDIFDSEFDNINL